MECDQLLCENFTHHVVRFNAHGPAAVNSPATTLRILGSRIDLTDWEKLDDYWFPCQGWIQEPILSTEKNKPLLSAMAKRATYYPANLPMHLYGMLQQLEIDLTDLGPLHRPLTTGTMALILFIKYCQPAEIRLIGYDFMSSTHNQYPQLRHGIVLTHKLEKVEKNHVKWSVELEIRRRLIDKFQDFIRTVDIKPTEN